MGFYRSNFVWIILVDWIMIVNNSAITNMLGRGLASPLLLFEEYLVNEWNSCPKRPTPMADLIFNSHT